MPWLAVLTVTVAQWLMKASGPLALGDRPLRPGVRRVIALMAPVLLAGLIVTDLAGERWQGLDAGQVLGVASAGVARALRVPMLAAIVVGAAVAALLRLAG